MVTNLSIVVVSAMDLGIHIRIRGSWFESKSSLLNELKTKRINVF